MRRVCWMLPLSVLAMAAGTVWAQPSPPSSAPQQATPAAGAKQEVAPGNPLEAWWQKANRFAAGDLGGFSFLDLDQVQKDLKLTQEQKDKLKAINEEFRAKRRKQIESATGATPENRPVRLADVLAKARENRAEYRKKIDAVLLPEQRNRLLQIVLQLRSPLAALADEEVAKTLQLTPEQRKQIQAIEEAAGEKIRSALQDLRQRRSAGQAELEAKASELRDQAVQQAMGVLTPEQKGSLEKMKRDAAPVERPRWGPFRRANPPSTLPQSPPPADKPAPSGK